MLLTLLTAMFLACIVSLLLEMIGIAVFRVEDAGAFV